MVGWQIACPDNQDVKMPKLSLLDKALLWVFTAILSL